MTQSNYVGKYVVLTERNEISHVQCEDEYGLGLPLDEKDYRARNCQPPIESLPIETMASTDDSSIKLLGQLGRLYYGTSWAKSSFIAAHNASAARKAGELLDAVRESIEDLGGRIDISRPNYPAVILPNGDRVAAGDQQLSTSKVMNGILNDYASILHPSNW